MASAATIRPQQFLPCNQQGRIKLRHGEPQRRFNFTNKSIVTSAALQHDSSVVENKKGNIGAAFVKHLTNFGRDGMSPVKTELAKALEVKITALEKQDIKDINTKAEKLAELTLEEILIHNFMEKSIKEAVNEAATSVSSELSSIAEEARLSVEAAKASAKRAEEALTQKLAELDKLPKPEFELLNLEESISSLEQQLEVSTEKVASLQKAAEYATSRAEYAEARAAKLEDDVRELRRKAEEGNEQRIQNFKNAVETLRKTAEAREQALKSSYEAQLEALRATIEASAKAEKIKEQANLRRFQALENALAASEASLQAWKEQALSGEKGDADLLKGGGRMTTLLGREKLADFVEGGPRTDTPDWIKKRIDAALQGIPPRTNTPEVIQDDVKHLELPSLEDVWSVAKAKVKQDDLYSKDVAAKETLDKQRRDLEHALEQTTIRKRKFIKETPHESGTGSGREIVLQGFNWESCRKRWYNDLAPKAADLSQCGITTVWLPPPTESVAPQGYMPVDLYNLNSAYGTKDELKHCIQEMHKHDLKVLGDVVLNHRCAHKQNANGIWNVFGGKLAWGPEAIVSDDPNFHGRGNPSSGDIFHAAPNIDHSQAFVREDIKEYLLWLKNEMGFDGWRLDFVRGFWGGHVKEYIEASEPAFAIGEYWDSLQYEGGNVAYNQDAHRQRIIDWINATGGTSSAFDVTTKGILHAALHNEYWRLIDPRGKPPGVLGWWSSRAVTFLENHDTGSTQGHWPFPRDKLLQGYAYILTHPGTPVVFYDHFYDFGLRDPIVELITARNRTGIHCRSPLKICHATNDGYVAKVDERLVVKLGRLDWNPSKQNDLIGNWKRTVDKGCEYQVWEKE